MAPSCRSAATPAGPLGFALAGSGNLTGGFKGLMAASSPHLIFGRCFAHAMRASTAIEVVARSPHVDGPFAAQQFACPASNFEMDNPRFELNSRFNESFTRFQGRGRMATPRLDPSGTSWEVNTAKKALVDLKYDPVGLLKHPLHYLPVTRTATAALPIRWRRNAPVALDVPEARAETGFERLSGRRGSRHRGVAGAAVPLIGSRLVARPGDESGGRVRDRALP